MRVELVRPEDKLYRFRTRRLSGLVVVDGWDGAISDGHPMILAHYLGRDLGELMSAAPDLELVKLGTAEELGLWVEPHSHKCRTRGCVRPSFLCRDPDPECRRLVCGKCKGRGTSVEIVGYLRKSEALK